MEDAENADINRAKPEAACKCVALECAMRRPLCRQSSYRCTQTRGLPPDNPHPLPTPRSLPEALLVKVHEELTCVICMDLTTRPSTLPCGHTACRRCLNRAPTMGEPEPQKRCPSCRAPMPAGMPPLALSTTLKSLAELLLPGESAACPTACGCGCWVLGGGGGGGCCSRRRRQHPQTARQQHRPPLSPRPCPL